MKLQSPTTKKSAALSLLLTFAALLVPSLQSAVVTNWMVDISGVAINRTVNFYPQSTPQSMTWGGTNVTVMDLAKSVASTNGAWAKQFVGGLYYADFGTMNDGTRTDRVLFLVPPNDSATYDFNYCANLATNLGTFVWTNNYYVQVTTNLAGNALVQTTNIALAVAQSVVNTNNSGNPNAITNNATGVTLSGTFSGNGAGLQLLNSATNAITNTVTYAMSFTSTNPIDAYAPDVGSEVNGRYYWNSTLNRYTNATLPYFIANQNEYTGGWYIGTNLSDPDGIANKWYYNGAVGMPIYESSAWSYGDAGGEAKVIWLGTIIATNKNFELTPESATFNFPLASWGGHTVHSINDIFGRVVSDTSITYSGPAIYSQSHFYVYPGFDFVPNTSSGTGNDGLQAYAWGLRAPTMLTSGDSRYSIGVGFLHGTNGQNGATFDFLNQFRSGYSTANNSGGFKIYMRFGTRGDTTVGDIPYSQHGTEPVANWRFGIYGGNGDGIMPNFGMGSGNMVAAPVAGGREFDGTNNYMTDNNAVRKRLLAVKTSANNIPAAITVGASPFAYTNATGTPLVFWHYGTNNYSIALNGVTVQSFNGTNGANMILAPTNRVVITYTAAPILNTNLFQF